MMVSNSLCSVCAYAGQPLVGEASASLNQIACTCCAVTPAAVKRCATTVQKLALGFMMIDAVCPPCAPSTGTTFGLRSGSATACVTKRENSCVQFDMPIERNTILPLAAGAPLASRGTTFAACARPPTVC